VRIGVFHPGTQHSWQTALAFQEAGTLAWYGTSTFYDPARWPYKLERYVPRKMSECLNREFRRRHNPLLDTAKVRQMGLWEWSEVLFRRLHQMRLSEMCNEIGNRAFCQQVIRLIEREPVDVLWGFNSSCLEVFQWARKRGIHCVLDQTIGHPATQNQVMLQEQERHPEFFVNAYRPNTPVWIDRQNREMAAADRVVVGSDFCGQGLIANGCPAEKIHLVQYGYDETLFPRQQPPRDAARKRPLQCLFVGEVGPRKGIAYLLQAMANLSPEQAQLTMVGRLAIPTATFQKYAGRVRHIPQVPRSEVARFFSEADCFVFPSLFEGSAIVLYEASGAGLGIIQSEQAGEGVRGGENGNVLKEISVPALTAALAQAADNPELCQRWQNASWSGRGDRTWRGYRQRVVELLAKL
jgi:glycosyltransferase involved in cell wall biosynthesis